MGKDLVIDIHTHVIALETARLMLRESPELGPRFTDFSADEAYIEWEGKFRAPLTRPWWDIESRFKDMDRCGIDRQLLSAFPMLLTYDVEDGLGAAFSAIQNEQIASHVRTYPDRFLGLATLPMQAPERAAAELRRAMTTLGLRGAEIGTTVRDGNLDDRKYDPVWAVADELKAFMLIHPRNYPSPRMAHYHLRNMIGNPLDTTIAAASLVFSGVLTRFPNIRFCLSHGGGALPYQAGRLSQGWRVHGETGADLAQSPDGLYGRFYYDTILYAPAPLEFLLESVGVPHVLLGSDYPADITPDDPVGEVRRLSLPPADETAILGQSAAILLDAVGSAKTADERTTQ